MSDRRFWAKVRADGDCWTWTGATNSRGYGCLGRGGKGYLAHRYAYALAVGPIPDGLTIDHLCGNKRCVRPEHLEPVTGAENTRRRFRGKVHGLGDPVIPPKPAHDPIFHDFLMRIVKRHRELVDRTA